MLYEDALYGIGRLHHLQVKWFEKLCTPIPWDHVWNAVHNVLNTNQTKETICEQIHLNYYTQYSYNKCFKKNEKCRLCDKIPESIFHIILQCEFTNKLWKEIDPLLKELHADFFNDKEKAFGLLERGK